MLSYIARRLVQLVPILLIIVCINFVLLRLAPGDPIAYLVGDAPADEHFLAELRTQLGLDRPLYEQLAIYLGQIVRGDLGYSYISRESVSTILLSRLPASLLLLGTQFVLSIVLGIVLGVTSARRQGRLVDQGVTLLSLIGFAVPAFWLAQMMILIFSLQLELFPSQGMRSLRLGATGWAAVWDVLH